MTNPDERPSPSHAEGRGSPWIAFRHRAFTVVWIATVVANVGTWMYNAASGWRGPDYRHQMEWTAVLWSTDQDKRERRACGS